MNRFRQWLGKAVTRLNCFVNGHSDVQILTRYPERERVKITGNIEGEKFKEVRFQKIDRVKARCGRCKRVFLDWSGARW